MRIAITSQNFRTITGHAGKARRFMIYETTGGGGIVEVDRLDLPLHMSVHASDERYPHPLDGVNVLITAGCGEGFKDRMARRGIRVAATAETDPETAIHAWLAGVLKPPVPHDHEHEHAHEHAEAHACGCRALQQTGNNRPHP